MELSPDALIYWQWGPIRLNATLIFTWLVMALLVLGSWLITRRVTASPRMSTGQNALESLMTMMRNQIAEIMPQKPDPFLPFIGTLFVFIAVANLLSVAPGYRAPTGSLSTTAALATAVFIAVPVFGIRQLGWRNYLRQYTQPTFLMLPFNIIGELSRTLGLAVRLFGNVMSGDLIVAILLVIVPLFFPIVMQLLGLLIGQIQAYIFAVLAAVYIASAIQNGPQEAHDEANEDQMSDTE